MWPLDKPSHAAADTFAVCISKVRNKQLKERLAYAASTIESASTEYDHAAQRGNLHTISRNATVEPDITTAEMEKVYTGRMVPIKSPGRPIYDELMTNAKNGRCPFCAQRQVATLDHVLPKSIYPAFAVAPLNLVPSCHECNKKKLTHAPSRAEDVCLHPYFDDLGSQRWLYAVVVETRPAAVRFKLQVPPNWNEVTVARVKHHFRLLGLGALYASEAAEELLHIRHQLVELLQRSGELGVRDELSRRAASAASGRTNGWRAATYDAWASSAWFCSGGFEAA